MGIWDAIHSVAEAVHRQTPDLNGACRTAYGIGVSAASASGGAIRNTAAQGGDLLYSAGNKVRRSASGLAPVAASAVSKLEDVKRSASGLVPAAASAVSTIEQVVRVDRIKGALTDPEVQRSVSQLALTVADYVAEEATKPYIGGLYRIGMNKLTKAGSRRGTATDPLKKELQEMREHVERMEAKIEHIELGLVPPPYRRYSHRSPLVCWAQKPEDVLRVFMMKGFNGADFLDDQVVPLAAKARNGPR